MKPTKHFLLVGHGGFHNRGCEAIVRCTTEIIKNAFTESDISLTSYDPEMDRSKIIYDRIPIDRVISWNGPPKHSLAWVIQGVHRRAFYADMLKHTYLHRHRYKKTDAVISIGGDNFSDDYGSPESFFRTLDDAKRYGAKTVIWGASIGPFNPLEAERKWAEYLKMVDLITAREDMTVSYLASLGVSTNVHRVCDPAFLLPAVEPKTPIPFGDSARMTVGIGMSSLMHRYGIMDQYLNSFVKLLEYITAIYHGEIVLVPHVIKDGTPQNDLAVCKELARRTAGKSRCHVLPKRLNACEMKYCISKCDYFVGARTHSTIASLSSYVPTISVGYSVKTWGINKDLLNCDDYVIDVHSINSDVLIRKFEQLHKQRETVVKRLQTSVPRAKEKAKRAGEYLLSLLIGNNKCRK